MKTSSRRNRRRSRARKPDRSSAGTLRGRRDENYSPSCFLVGTLALVAVSVARPAIFAAFLDAFVMAGIQSGSTQLRRAAILTVTIPVATTSVLISIVAAVTVLSVMIVWTLRLGSYAQGCTYSKQQ